MGEDQGIEELPAMFAAPESGDQTLRIDPNAVLQRLAAGHLTQEDLAAAVALAHEIVNRTGEPDA